jgi:hypothetical protein
MGKYSGRIVTIDGIQFRLYGVVVAKKNGPLTGYMLQPIDEFPSLKTRPVEEVKSEAFNL